MALETGKRYRIRYRSESGEVSDRGIDILESRTGFNGVTYLKAYCHLRQEERTFRADRILSSEIVPANASRPGAVATSSRPAPAPSALLPRAAAPAPPRGPLPSIAAGAMRPTASGASAAASESPRRRLSGAFVFIAILFQLMLAASILFGKSEPSRYVPSTTVTNSYAPVGYASVPKPAPSPPPKPSIEETTIGGLTLRTVRSGTGERYERPISA
ncbi:MAG: WYL domain-containing protein [Rhodopseudomonas palustris]|nr:WYL domain-containing protein [Rhodopseudomonas palustris]